MTRLFSLCILPDLFLSYLTILFHQYLVTDTFFLFTIVQLVAKHCHAGIVWRYTE